MVVVKMGMIEGGKRNGRVWTWGDNGSCGGVSSGGGVSVELVGVMRVMMKVGR